MDTLLETIKNNYLKEKELNKLLKNNFRKKSYLKNEENINNSNIPRVDTHLNLFHSANDFIDKWSERNGKTMNDYRLYNLLEPLIRFNSSKKIITRGITLPGESWRWEQNMFSAFKNIPNSKFEIIGAENSSSIDKISNFYYFSNKINKRPGSNANTIPYNGNIFNIINGEHNIETLKKNKFVDFIYADMCSYWHYSIVDFCVSIFKNDILKPNGLFFLTIFLVRGSLDTELREQTIEIGQNLNKWIPSNKQFEVFDSNSLCREEKQKSGAMSDKIHFLVKGICAFIYRQAQKNGINLKVYNPNIYYNECTLPDGKIKRNPLASMCFETK